MHTTHLKRPSGTMQNFTTACCGDHRLNTFISALDGNSSYRRRDLGAPSDFIIDLSALLIWHQKLIGFGKGEAPITDAMILVHTDCLAVQKNAFFRMLKTKRARYAMTHEGDIDFCIKQLENIRARTEPLSGSVTIRWHFGIIDTSLAECLPQNATRQDALDCMRWPFEMPEFFTMEKEASRIIPINFHPHHPQQQHANNQRA